MFEGNELLGLIERLRGSFYHRADNYVVNGVGTIGTIAKFTGTQTIGNSILTESGAALSAAGALTLVGQSNTNQFILKGYSTQTSPQILIQTSAAAELARLYVNATYSIALGYQAGASLGASTGSVLIGYQAGNALTTNDIIAIGYQAGYSATAGQNVFIGKNAGRLTVGGNYNVAIGENALQTNVSGQSSFALGYGALALATASENVAIGASALQKCSTGYYNVGIGTLALGELLGATGNLAIGQSALRNLVSGTDNVGLGTSAGYSATGSNNTLIGHTAGGSCTGSNNVIIGWHAGRYTGATSGFGECVYIGVLAGGGTGNYCVGIGRETLTANVTAATAVGYQAGKVATGAGNVFLGYQAGVAVSSGANNTILGYQAGASLSTNGGAVHIGYQAGNAETNANTLYIANSSTTTPLIYGLFSGTGAGLRITSQATDGTPLVVRGKASQTNTLQEWQDSTSAVVASVNKAGMISGSMDTMTYAATITLDVTLPNLHKTTTVHATGNATINASAAGTAGQHIWILIVNDATSGKVITFGTNFKSTGTLTGTASKQATIHFISDGVSWSEVARTLNL